MDIGKKMMEKMGWTKGQGLGKDNKGMTGVLLLKKQDGSSTQGRIEMSAPVAERRKAPATEKAKPAEAGDVASSGSPAAQANSILESVGTELGVSMPSAPDEDPDDPAAKRRKRSSRWEGQDVAEATAGPQTAPGGGAGFLFPPMESSATSGGGMMTASGNVMFDIDPRDAEAAAVALQQTGQHAVGSASGGYGGFTVGSGGATSQPAQPSAPQGERFVTLNGTEKVKMRGAKQWVIDDWRWSQGKEALRYFEEMVLTPELLPLARKVISEGSRYPARIADDTDCIAEVTAWGSLLVRPRGTGANLSLAKRMLYEVLHPGGEHLREEMLITPDEMAEAAIRDKSTIHADFESNDDAKAIFKEGVSRTIHGELKRVGLGAEEEAKMEAHGLTPTADLQEMELPTAEDAALVKTHLDSLRTSSGVAAAMLNGLTLKLFGKDKPVRKARQLVKSLVDTGEWVALTEGFVLSEETKEKRRADEGPSEQILIKVAEGPVLEKIEKHLRAMERAALADTMKLTSKAVAGKRTLMVDGTKAAHERVKWMIRELTDTGSSPMLTKALGVAKKADRPAVDEAAIPSFTEHHKTKPSATGVVSAAPVITRSTASVEATPERPITSSAPGLGPGGMRHLPPPKLAASIAAGDDLFANLPAPGASADLFAGLPAPAPQPAPVAPAGAVDITAEEMAAAEEELTKLMQTVKDSADDVGVTE
mmetsp:Transcript_65718/g.140581  ORF Transcript_65718/g.140581 Transcript_65718/m.140581 type:complete len:708 (+) Transcript_65718:94-2217(+)